MDCGACPGTSDMLIQSGMAKTTCAFLVCSSPRNLQILCGGEGRVFPSLMRGATDFRNERVFKPTGVATFPANHFLLQNSRRAGPPRELQAHSPRKQLKGRKRPFFLSQGGAVRSNAVPQQCSCTSARGKREFRKEPMDNWLASRLGSSIAGRSTSRNFTLCH
eukprot:scaffold2639_cov361-Pavlova_lutheri.AAC.69